MGKVAIFLADGFEEIEGLTVVDLLRRAEIEIEMVSISDSDMVTGAHNIKVKADKTFQEVEFQTIDMIILPGGMPGTKNLLKFEPLNEKIKEFYKKGNMLAAICAAPMILGANGILVGKKATCYPGFEQELKGAEVVPESVVIDGNIITSRGLGTAIEFAGVMIEHLKDKKLADNIKESIIYKR